MQIVISIQSMRDLKKLERRLFFYRSFLCRFISFSNQGSCLPIDSIVKALNIKNKKQRIVYIYDTLCKQVDSFYSKKNLCDFQQEQCVVQRRKGKYKNGCCRLCKYSSPRGCITSNFTCKMFYCFSVKEKNRTLSPKDLPLLKCFGFRQRFLLRYEFFSSREDILTDLWIESILINFFRIYPRFFSNIFLRKH